jgi:hypothetical protein
MDKFSDYDLRQYKLICATTDDYIEGKLSLSEAVFKIKGLIRLIEFESLLKSKIFEEWWKLEQIYACHLNEMEERKIQFDIPEEDKKTINETMKLINFTIHEVIDSLEPSRYWLV